MASTHVDLTQPSDQEFDEFIDVCERITTLSNELNRYNLSNLKTKTFQLEAHEQAIYTLHIRHVLDFCQILDVVSARSGPNVIPASTPVAPSPSSRQSQPSAIATPPSEPIHNAPRAVTTSVPRAIPIVGDANQRAATTHTPASSSISNYLNETSSPAAGVSGTYVLDRVYYAGMDFTALSDMDINIRKGDRVKIVTLMDDDGMGLGSNIETGAMGTFPIQCIMSGTLAPEGAEEEVIASPEAEETAASEAGPGGSAATPVRSKEWSPVPVPNPLNRKIGRHVASRSYQSGSVLEASLERGDEVEIMFWEDDEIAVGIHLPTQSEGLFRGSMLLYAGPDPNAASSSGAVGSSSPQAGIAGGVRILPLNDGRVVEIPADIPFNERKESLDTVVRGNTTTSAASKNDSERKNILAAVVAFQQNDANQYKDYLDRIDGPSSNQPSMSRNMTAAVVPSLRNSPVQVSLDNIHPSLLSRGSTHGSHAGTPGSKLPHNLTIGSSASGGSMQGPSSPNTPLSPTLAQNPTIAALAASNTVTSNASSSSNVHAPPRVSSAVFGMTVSGNSGLPGSSAAGAELTPDEERRLQGAKHVLTELHATEESYMNLLKVFQFNVVEPMRNAHILSNVDIDRAFKHLQPIHELSVKVESHLREAAQSGTGDPTPVVNLFLKNIQHEEWKVYENYIKNYQPAKQIIQKMTARTDAKGEQFRAFCRKIEKDDACDRKNLDDFMMLPIQRITRYWLLLERLKKYMEPESVMYESIDVAERYMKEVGNTLQGVQIREEEMRKMFEIVNTVDNCPSSILSYSKRRFVAEYDCMDLVGAAFGYGITPAAGGVFNDVADGIDGYQLVSNMVQAGPGPRRLFVFTDCILVAAYRTGRKAASVTKKLELVQKLDSKRVMIDNRRDDFEMETDIILRLRIVSPFVGKPDDSFHFRMSDVRSRKAVEKTIMVAHAQTRA